MSDEKEVWARFLCAVVQAGDPRAPMDVHVQKANEMFIAYRDAFGPRRLPDPPHPPRCQAMGPDKNPKRLFMRCVLSDGHYGPHEIHLREDVEPTYWWDTESQKESEG